MQNRSFSPDTVKSATLAGDSSSGLMVAGAGELTPGSELAAGRFRIEATLGRGSMGVVYAALDRERGERVALKTLRPGGPQAERGIKHEFRALADIAHPGLVRLYELFVRDGRCFFTMELVDGVDFIAYVTQAPASGEFLRDGSSTVPSVEHRVASSALGGFGEPNLERLFDSIGKLAHGVHALHLAGKMHRDLKPSNVRVRDDGRLSILDFGLVLDAPDSAALAQRGEIGGTPLYMAPEIFQGRPATPASDWYAVGVMLHEALTGTVPACIQGADLTGLDAPANEAHAPLRARLTELCRELLRREPELRPGAERILELLGAERGSSLPPWPARARVSRLFGRTRQLAALHAAFDGAEDPARPRDRPCIALVSGASGTGKTALLEHFGRSLKGRATVLVGRCYENEAVPHKAFDELVERLAKHLAGLPQAARDRLLAGRSHELGALFPALGEAPKPGHVRAPDSERAPEKRRRAYEALGELLSELSAAEPLLIGIDDLHWGDVDSARLLKVILERSPSLRGLVLVTYREDEVGSSPCLQQLLGGGRSLSEWARVTELRVSPLDADDARQLAEGLFSAQTPMPARAVDAVCAEAEGNPLLLRELVEHLAHGGSGGALRDVVRARTSRLAPGERLLFELVCVSGRPLRQSLLKTIPGAPEELPAAVTRLRAERLLRERTSLRPDVIDVFHDRIRQAELEELAPAELTARHGLLAVAHERAAEPDAEALFQHHAACGSQAKASLWAERAAEQAASALALNRAAELYRLAAELEARLPERRAALRAKLAQALSDAGRGPEAAPIFLELAAGLAPAEALEFKRRAAEQWLAGGHVDEALAALEVVLNEVGLKLPRTPRAALLDLLLTRLRLWVRGLEPSAPRADAEARLRLLRADVCRAAWPLSYVNTIQGAAFQARFLELALATGDPYRISLGLGMQAIHVSMAGGEADERSLALRRRANELAAGLDLPHATGFGHLVEGHSSYLCGRWLPAIEALEQGERVFRERCRGATWELNSTRFFWGNSLIHVGRWRELERRLDAWQRDADDRADLFASASLLLTRTRTLTLAGDRADDAERMIAEALRVWRSREFGVQQFLASLSRIQVALYRGDTEAALGLVRELWPSFSKSLMSRIQLCRIHARHHTCNVLLARAAEAPRERSPLLRRARRLARQLRAERMPWAGAFASYVEGRAYQLEGRDAASVEPLRAACELHENGSMILYGAAATTRLAEALGGAVGARMREGALALFQAQGCARPDQIARMMAP